MNSKLLLANIFRTIARILSILIVILIILYMLIIGLQLESGEPGNLAIIQYLILLSSMTAGLVIAWWREGLGAAIVLGSILGSFALRGEILPGVGGRQIFSLLVGPLNLPFSLLISGYYPDNNLAVNFVSVASWVILIVTVLLFFVSWLLRRESPK